MKQATEELLKELNQIRGRLLELKKIHKDDLEVVFMSSTYNEAKHVRSTDFISIINNNNYDYYKNFLERDKFRKAERNRFIDVKHLKEFLVVCVNDEISPEVAELFGANQGDWVKRGSTYVCVGMKRSIDGYSLILKNTKENGGELLRVIEPFKDYSSIRFDIYNYPLYN